MLLLFVSIIVLRVHHARTINHCPVRNPWACWVAIGFEYGPTRYPSFASLWSVQLFARRMPSVDATSSLFTSPQPAKRVRVVLLGMSGAGKSTLGNLLVYGQENPDQGGFEIGHGKDSKTTVCRGLTCTSAKGKMTVYDTPGVPDTDKRKTLHMFNEVVKTVRQLPTLNGIVFLLKAGRKDSKHYEAYRILFRQYTKLPCLLVVACRVDCKGCPEHEERNKVKGAEEMINKVIENCNMKSARVHKLIYKQGDEGKGDVNNLRFSLGLISGVPVADGTLMTSDEMEKRLSRLSHREKRIDELKKEIPRLQNVQERLRTQISNLNERIHGFEEELKKEKGGSSVTLTGIRNSVEISALTPSPSSPSCVDVSGARSRIAWLRGGRQIFTNLHDSNDEELSQMVEEVKSGMIDPKELENAREEYQQILNLTKR